MNFTNLNIKLIEDNGYCDVLIRVDDAFANEFGEEFGSKIFSADDSHNNSLREHIRSSFPGKKLRRIRLTLNGITLATVPVLTKAERLARNTQHLGLVSTYRSDAEPEDSGVQLQDYEVKPGDTLWIIAAKFNTTSDALTSINNLEGVPEAGRKISVPLSLALAD
ncbi:MAG: LysM peptidoglycan-binding domain-containing protein [Defluviitaleaceae bacterium]|nr:LysM peptidoglycan-binding domain-containing protein [Defluviitaleaceae bacterium]